MEILLRKRLFDYQFLKFFQQSGTTMFHFPKIRLETFPFFSSVYSKLYCTEYIILFTAQCTMSIVNQLIIKHVEEFYILAYTVSPGFNLTKNVHF